MSHDELQVALAEAREAARIADEKAKAASDIAWVLAREAAGEAGEDNSINGFLAVAKELEKLPRVGFQAGAFYNEAGDMIECYWKNCPTITHWINHVVSVKKCWGGDLDYSEKTGEDHSKCHGTVVGVAIHWAKLILERSDTFITPDPPNPSKAVEEAKALGVCRVCRKKLDIGTAPAGVKERFGSQVYGDSIVFNCGEEYAHQACLNMEAKGVNEGID